MKLSEAAEVGLLVGMPIQLGHWDYCFLGVAGNVVGIPSHVECCRARRTRPIQISERWPWLDDKTDHPQFSSFSYRFAIMSLFDWSGPSPEAVRKTFADLLEYVRSVEPDCGECNRRECTCVKTEPVVEAAELVGV